MTDNDITRLIAETVMGYRWADGTEDPPLEYQAGDVNRGNFDPLKYTEDAFEVVDKMVEDGWRFNLLRTDRKTWEVDLFVHSDKRNVCVEDPSRCKAICLAALRAVGVEV